MRLPAALVGRQDQTPSTTVSVDPSSTVFTSSTLSNSVSSSTSSSSLTSTLSSTSSTRTSTSATPTATAPPPPENHNTGSSGSTYIPVGATIGAVAVFILIYFLLRSYRKTHPNPTYIPTSFLKSQWARWTPKTPRSSRDSSGLEQLSSRQPPSSFASTGAANSEANRAANAAIDRNTSIRSVMTLPAYRPKAGDSEQVLGREGERGGMDTVIEFPVNETAEETMRDEEMEALYQVRVARRTEAAEREERRRLRREARERGDLAALRELRNGSDARDSTGPSTLEAARAAHDALRTRERTVSSVSYADLGVARHDGTRIRANSEESERPLLGDAASMASSRRPSNVSGLAMHHRDQSRNSVISVDTQGSNELPSPGFQAARSRTNSGASLVMNRTHTHSGSMSSPEIIEHEDGQLPDHEPPEYVDVSLEERSPMGAPPEYFSPVDGRVPEGPLGQAPTSTDSTTTRPVIQVPEIVAGVVSAASPTAVEEVLGAPTTKSNRNSARGSSSRGVGAMPQLPSLRLNYIPSISVSESSPVVRQRSEARGDSAESARPEER